MQLGTAVSRTGLLPCLASLSRELPLQRSFVTSPGWRSNLEAWPHNTSRSNAFSLTRTWVWAPPRSLATTSGISVDVCSSGYLDVSVPRVAFDAVCVRAPMHGHGPVRVFPFGDLRLVSDICSLPQLIAASHVLHRLPMPRHPPCALDIFLHTNNRFAIHAKKIDLLRYATFKVPREDPAEPWKPDAARDGSDAKPCESQSRTRWRSSVAPCFPASHVEAVLRNAP